MDHRFRALIALAERRPRLDSHHRHGDSQPTITLVPGDPPSLPTSSGTRQACAAHMHRQAKHLHTTILRTTDLLSCVWQTMSIITAMWDGDRRMGSSIPASATQ